jgi:hypothetical protein
MNSVQCDAQWLQKRPGFRVERVGEGKTGFRRNYDAFAEATAIGIQSAEMEIRAEIRMTGDTELTGSAWLSRIHSNAHSSAKLCRSLTVDRFSNGLNRAGEFVTEHKRGF